MIIHGIQSDLFSLKLITVFSIWNLFQIIPIIFSLYSASKTVFNCNKLMISVLKIVNEWDNDEVLNRV